MPGVEKDAAGDWTPRPDPTALTTAQLYRELANTREILQARMDSMDNERRLMLQIINERSDEVSRRFDERDALFTEREHETSRRFADQGLLFGERDATQKEAVQTALAAARELIEARNAAIELATGKFEAAVRDSIQQLSVLAGANRDLLDGKIDALRQRIDRAEAGTDALAGQRAISDRQAALRITVAAVGISAVVIVVNILLYVLSHR